MMIRPRLKRLVFVTATTEASVYMARIEAVDTDGSLLTDDFCSRPDDAFGLGPEVRAAIETWIAEGKPVLPSN